MFFLPLVIDSTRSCKLRSSQKPGSFFQKEHLEWERSNGRPHGDNNLSKDSPIVSLAPVWLSLCILPLRTLVQPESWVDDSRGYFTLDLLDENTCC